MITIQVVIYQCPLQLLLLHLFEVIINDLGGINDQCLVNIVGFVLGLIWLFEHRREVLLCYFLVFVTSSATFILSDHNPGGDVPMS